LGCSKASLLYGGPFSAKKSTPSYTTRIDR
jgi:hypothetical protein